MSFRRELVQYILQHPFNGTYCSRNLKVFIENVLQVRLLRKKKKDVHSMNTQDMSNVDASTIFQKGTSLVTVVTS